MCVSLEGANELAVAAHEPHDLVAVERLASRQVVIAGVEPESQEVRLRHEARLVDRGAERRRLAFLRAPLVALGPELPAVQLALIPAILVRAAIRFGDRDAIELERAAHVDAVAHVPRVLALEAVERRPSRPEDLEQLDLVEHVVAQRFAIHVAPLQRARHERIEVGRVRRRRLAGGRDRDAGHGQHHQRGHE